MLDRRTTLTILGLLGALALGGAGLAKADDYPSRPITLVVPFPPGGSTSIVARIIADKMSPTLGQPVVIDNRGGAGGTVGARGVARAEPDGYTLLLGYTGTLAIGPSLYPNVGYDPRKDFEAIGRIGAAPSSIVVNPSFPVHSVAELIAYAKANPGKVNFGSAGVGSVNHVAGELFSTMAGIKLTHIPYKGTGPALNDLLGNHIPLAFAPIPSTHALAQGGKLRMLAVTSLKRSALVPDVPTVAESGLPGFQAVLTYGPSGARRHAAPDHRQAQQGTESGARLPGGAKAISDRGRGRRAEHARRIRRRDRSGGSPMVEDRSRVGRKGGVKAPSFARGLLCRARAGSRRLAVAAASALVFAASAGPGWADDYPSRPITLIVPYAAGGGNDLVARIVAEPMSKTLGQQIVIENRGGAGGSIATRQGAHAAPDGYTLLLGGTGTLAVDPTLYPNVGYDPRRDFAPVGLIATSALVLVVHPSVPANTVAELIALARREPGRVAYASAGAGSGIHLAAELFAHMAGIKLTHIPYKGSAPALNDLLGGHVSVYFSSLPPAMSLVREGKLRALAVTSATRSDAFANLPTVAEAALPGYEAVLHYGIVAPAGTPDAIVARLNKALRAALADKAVRERLAAAGVEPLASTPEDYAADIDREERKWSADRESVGSPAGMSAPDRHGSMAE